VGGGGCVVMREMGEAVVQWMGDRGEVRRKELETGGRNCRGEVRRGGIRANHMRSKVGGGVVL